MIQNTMKWVLSVPNLFSWQSESTDFFYNSKHNTRTYFCTFTHFTKRLMKWVAESFIVWSGFCGKESFTSAVHHSILSRFIIQGNESVGRRKELERKCESQRLLLCMYFNYTWTWRNFSKNIFFLLVIQNILYVCIPFSFFVLQDAQFRITHTRYILLILTMAFIKLWFFIKLIL